MLNLLPLLAVLTVASITPGPNNLIVLTLASVGGLAAALPAIAGVILGSLILLLLSWLGISALLMAYPGIQLAIAIAGALYLGWMGLGLFRTSAPKSVVSYPLPRGMTSVALFQLANPKAWLLVIAVTVIGKGGGSTASMATVALLMVLVCGLCLLVWAMMGASLSGWLAHANRRKPFNRIMGALLIGSAPLLFL